MRKLIPGFSDYAADDRGRLWTRRRLGGHQGIYGRATGKWRLLPMQVEYFRQRQAKNPAVAKYLTVRIGVDGTTKRKRMMVHTLVALAFLGPRPVGMFVAHGVGGALDNRPSNLSYKTPAQNKADEIRDGTRYKGSRHHERKINAAKWRELLKRWNSGERKSLLCQEYGISRQAVHRELARRDPCPVGITGWSAGLMSAGL